MPRVSGHQESPHLCDPRKQLAVIIGSTFDYTPQGQPWARLTLPLRQ
ncbi:MAG TPA: hypothetical protein VKM54_07920 [Myxococcota bacterium]|nr:hypothetical protein [Myxococcota bacterium]